MNKLPFLFILLFCWIVFSSWGFYAHKKINETAVFLLPAELAMFYKKNIKLITEKAVDPDKRCYIDSLEPTRHYIDLNEIDENIDSIPIHWSKASEKYTERKLLAQGVIPWQIWRTYQNLVKAFTDKNNEKIIRYSADLGHYIGDAHVPLHTTSNYNGQQTNQIGIHAFWESRLPEMFIKDYNLIIGPSLYIDDPLAKAWEIVKSSNIAVDSVLDLEKQLSRTFQESQIKSYIERNNQLIRTYSDSYAIAYHHALNGMVERRLRSSIQNVASFWYSAWVDAGQPKLDSNIKTDVIEIIPVPTNVNTLGREEWL